MSPETWIMIVAVALFTGISIGVVVGSSHDAPIAYDAGDLGAALSRVAAAEARLSNLIQIDGVGATSTRRAQAELHHLIAEARLINRSVVKT